jgi:Fe-S-cluster containining protein
MWILPLEHYHMGIEKGVSEGDKMLYFLNVPLTLENGLYFLRLLKCQRCGQCCKLKGGTQIAPDEVETLARRLDLSTHCFKEKHTFTQNGIRFLNTPCPFNTNLTNNGGGTGCTIYLYRPRVCHQYPFNTPWIKDGKPFMTVSACPAGKIIGEQFGFIPTQEIIYGPTGVYLGL